MPELERFVLARLASLDEDVRAHYENYDFTRVFSTVFNFATNDLSAFYFDIRKDALYCDKRSSVPPPCRAHHDRCAVQSRRHLARAASLLHDGRVVDHALRQG
jgi:isoleucyl-tRNA synthetase